MQLLIYNQQIKKDGTYVLSWQQLGIFIGVLGEGNGTPLQYSCLENPMDGRAW